MAESELGVLSSQSLARRIPDKPTLEKEVAAWQDHRNKHHAKAAINHRQRPRKAQEALPLILNDSGDWPELGCFSSSWANENSNLA